MVLFGRLLPLALAWVGLRAAQGLDSGAVNFESKFGKVYDTKPKIKVKGSGFGQLSFEDVRNLKFDPPMEVGGGVLQQAAVQSDDTIVLELAPGARWAESSGSLMLVEAEHGGKQLIADPVLVASVIPTPTVHPSDRMLYLTVSPHVMINGTNFDTKTTALFFSPPLSDGTDVTIFVKSSTTIWVNLVQKAEGTQWADEPGPLKLVAIDTGAGRLLLREDLGGVTIAEMQADMKGHSLSVETHEEVTMYQSSKVLTIAGQGFNASYTRFRFANSLLEERNFTQVVTPESATFTLEEGSKWRQDAPSWPAPLVLLAADAGDGFVPLGATTAKAGRKVATIFEDPRLEPSLQEIGRTLTHEFYLRGTGFTKAFPPIITFEPLADRDAPIDRDDFMVQVVNRTAVKLSLASFGGGWMPLGETGNLRVRAINTGGGMYTMDEPVPIAVVVSDDAPHRSGIHLKPDYVTQLYQSSKNKLILEGEGFPMDKEAHLEFGFGGPKEGTFSCSTLSETQLAVTLDGDNKWAHQGGPLFLLKAKFGEAEGDEEEVDYTSPGLKVATILDDPSVSESHLHAYASHTKHITIHGIGFLSTFNFHVKPKLVLNPTLAGDYEIKEQGWTDETVTISLSTDPGAMWANVRAEDQTVEVKVVSIDTGGGEVFMPGGGVVIAEVRKDDATFNCEDSCVYANDGQCDEDRDGMEALNWSGAMTDSNGESESFTSEASGSRGYLGTSAIPGEDSDDLVLVNAPSCPLGTDCTDCGLELAEEGRCTNTCRFARDGVCDDRRAVGLCADGTDCQDCGPWDQSNFTEVVEYAMSFSDAYDDDGFLANDASHPILDGQTGNGIGRFKRVFVKHNSIRKGSDKAEGVFMETLWAAIVLVGCSVTTYLTVLVVRCARGEKVELPIPTNPDLDRSRR